MIGVRIHCVVGAAVYDVLVFDDVGDLLATGSVWTTDIVSLRVR